MGKIKKKQINKKHNFHWYSQMSPNSHSFVPKIQQFARNVFESDQIEPHCNQDSNQKIKTNNKESTTSTGIPKCLLIAIPSSLKSNSLHGMYLKVTKLSPIAIKILTKRSKQIIKKAQLPLVFPNVS